MFKKIFRDFFILFGLAALSLSTSRAFMGYVARVRDGDKWWDANPMKGGNLAVLADLTFLKKFYCPDEIIKRADYNGPRNTVLYLDGDSYTWSLRDTNFASGAFHFISRYGGGCYHLDTAKKNILVLEVTEIWIRRYFNTLRMYDELYDSTEQKNITGLHPASYPRRPAHAALLPMDINCIFNKNINQNLQCNLFNYNFMTPMFQYKAALNYYTFKRASGDVVISKDGNFLFLKTSVSWTDTGSSYVPLLPGEKDLLVANFNSIYDHYKAKGFKEVYLSLIPSTVSVMQPEGYNGLIPMIQDDPRLRMKIIDVYYTFKNSPQLLFFRGDVHWNNEGKQKWVDMVNKILITNDTLSVK